MPMTVIEAAISYAFMDSGLVNRVCLSAHPRLDSRVGKTRSEVVHELRPLEEASPETMRFSSTLMSSVLK